MQDVLLQLCEIISCGCMMLRSLCTGPSCAWLCLAVLGCAWLRLAVLGCAWLCLAALGCVWLCLAVLGCTGLCLAVIFHIFSLKKPHVYRDLLGDIVQLVERMLCTHEVIGPTPIISSSRLTYISRLARSAAISRVQTLCITYIFHPRCCHLG